MYANKRKTDLMISENNTLDLNIYNAGMKENNKQFFISKKKNYFQLKAYRRYKIQNRNC